MTAIPIYLSSYQLTEVHPPIPGGVHQTQVRLSAPDELSIDHRWHHLAEQLPADIGRSVCSRSRPPQPAVTMLDEGSDVAQKSSRRLLYQSTVKRRREFSDDSERFLEWGAFQSVRARLTVI